MIRQDSFFISPLLDREQLEMLSDTGQCGDASSLLNEILELYEQESAQKFTELETGREKGDYDLMARAAHSLAGSSANLGGREVWRIAKEIENLCKGRKGPQACELLAGLEDAYASTIVALKAYLKSCSTEAGK